MLSDDGLEREEKEMKQIWRYEGLVMGALCMVFQVSAFALPDPNGRLEQTFEQMYWQTVSEKEPLASKLPQWEGDESEEALYKRRVDWAKFILAKELTVTFRNKVVAELGKEGISPTNFRLGIEAFSIQPIRYSIEAKTHDVTEMEKSNEAGKRNEAGKGNEAVTFYVEHPDFSSFSPFLEPAVKNGEAQILGSWEKEGDLLILVRKDTFYSGTESTEEKWKRVSEINQNAIIDSILQAVSTRKWIEDSRMSVVRENLRKLPWGGIIHNHGLGVRLEYKATFAVNHNGDVYIVLSDGTYYRG